MNPNCMETERSGIEPGTFGILGERALDQFAVYTFYFVYMQCIIQPDGEYPTNEYWHTGLAAKL